MFSALTRLSKREKDPHHPKVLAALLKHVKNATPTGKLVIVSKAWNADNTDLELELRKSCLFYQQNVAKPPKS